MIVVVIPAYNEEKTVGNVVQRALGSRVLVVDDGSTDRTAEVAEAAGAVVLRHPINRGLGAALSTGIEGASQVIARSRATKQSYGDGEEIATSHHGGTRDDDGEDIIVTLDADGQHDPAEIPRVIAPIVRGEAEVVIGSRFLSSRPACAGRQARTIYSSSGVPSLAGRSREVPLIRVLANFCGNFFTWLLFGIWISDSQSGFRAFRAEAAAKLRLRTSTMEVSSEIIREIARLKFKWVEVPITVRYTPYSLTKGQGFFRGLETLWKLIALRFFR